MRVAVRRRCQRGFTLLEVVVALALFSLVMTLVYGGFTTAVRAYEAGQLRTDEGSRRRVVSDFLRRGIAGATPIAVADDQEWSLLFGGEADSLRFVADLPGHVGVGGLHELVVESERRDGELALVMRRRALVIDEDGEVVGDFDTRVLLDRVDRFDVRFLGRDDDGDPLTWRDEWAEDRRMPELVELVISDPGGDEWPALRIRPRVDTVRYQGAGSLPGGGRAEQPAVPEAGTGPVPTPDSSTTGSAAPGRVAPGRSTPGSVIR